MHSSTDRKSATWQSAGELRVLGSRAPRGSRLQSSRRLHRARRRGTAAQPSAGEVRALEAPEFGAVPMLAAHRQRAVVRVVRGAHAPPVPPASCWHFIEGILHSSSSCLHTEPHETFELSCVRRRALGPVLAYRNIAPVVSRDDSVPIRNGCVQRFAAGTRERCCVLPAGVRAGENDIDRNGARRIKAPHQSTLGEKYGRHRPSPGPFYRYDERAHPMLITPPPFALRQAAPSPTC